MKEERERPPLRVILQNFINHVENLEAYRRENSYEQEFQDLKLFSENLKTVGDYSCKEGEKEINRKKNRYKDILPFDYTRVTLSEYVGVHGSDYINANYIKGASGSPAYIASQGPLPHTVNDFWRMVVECEVQVIVMACNEEESGKHKCENYWVEKEGEEKKFGMATIRLLKASTICPDFLVRTMQLKYMNAQSILEERVVCQFHYGAWPDHGVPGLVRPLLEMVRLVRDTQASETLPVLVHCSAGCGRTGTICAIDYVWGLLRAGKLKLDFSLFDLVRDMRKQRIAMVQTKDQYILVHQAVKELFQDQLRMIHSHPYENIDIRGLPIVQSPSKTAILYPGKTSASEEKQDGREKESRITSNSVSTEEATALAVGSSSDAPPLPHKKRIHIISSKQEKEVENLTQRQLAIASASGNVKLIHQPSPVKHTATNDEEVIETNLKAISAKPLPTPVTVLDHSPMNNHACSLHQPLSSPHTEGTEDLQKPSIAKLRALFESNSSAKETRPTTNAGHVVAKPRFPQLVTRSHSLGAVRKPQKFTQFTSGGCETGAFPTHSSDLCESERYKSVSNTHVDISCSNCKGGEISLDTPTAKVESLLNSNPSGSIHDSGPESAPYYETKTCDPTAGMSMFARKSTEASAELVPSFKHENTSHPMDIPPGTNPENPRPTLPIKRSKSLKAKMSGDTFKLSLSKRDHGQSQELPTSDNCSVTAPHLSLVDGKAEVKSVSKVTRGFESVCQGKKQFPSQISKANVSVKPQFFQNTDKMEQNEASAPAYQRADINEAFSSKVSISSGPSDTKSGLLSHSGMKKSGADSEKFLGGSEKKKVEHLNKPNCDVCRAQSLNLKREKSSHTLKNFSQESQYVNLKKVNVSNSSKSTKEPLKYKALPDKIGCSKAPLQPQNSLPVEASGVYEYCTNYLISEGDGKPSASESQRIAAVNARHKVDTVVGGLGIRERRNSFRRAVGQGIDDKSSSTIKKNSIRQSNNSESYSLPHPEAAPFKKQFDHLPSNSAMVRESEETLAFDQPLRVPNERNKVVEGNVMFKSPPAVQKFPLGSDCKYLKGIEKLSENYVEASNLKKHGKLTRVTESSPISSDVVQKSVRSNRKIASDSSSFHNSNLPWMQSVGTGDKQAAHNPGMHNSNTSDALFSPSKSSKEAHLWPTQQYNDVPLKKGNLIDAPHAVEMQLGVHLNPNLAVPLEVDVDQVGASMRHNFQDKTEGIKTAGNLVNSNPGNSGASTHFIRALEVFQQTAASIRTKFSWSAGSGSNSLKSPEPSPKTSPVAPSQPQLPKTHLNAGGYRKGEINVPSVSDKPKILRKQQQYL